MVGGEKTKGLYHYDWEIRDEATGRLNISAMRDALRGLNANGYGYLIWHGAAQYGNEYDLPDLTPFLESMLDLQVWVALLPDTVPAEQMPPYGHDYVSWAQALANLSLTHRNLKGMIIDDFCYTFSPVIGSNGRPTGILTPSYMSQVYNAKNAVNPSFKILAGFYTRPEGRAGEPTEAVWNAYGNSLDGIEIAHWDINQSDAYLEERLLHARNIIGNKPMIGTFYAVYPAEGPWIDPEVNEGGTLTPTPELLNGWIETIHRNCDSTMAYCTPLPMTFPVWQSNVWNLYSWIYDTVSLKYEELTPIFPLVIIALAAVPVALILWWLLKK